METKTCSDCAKTFPLTDEFFYRRSDDRTAFIRRCKVCHVAKCKTYKPVRPVRVGKTDAQRRTERLEARRELRKQQALARNASGSRRCKCCGLEKDLSEFEPNKKCDMGYGYRCLVCRNKAAVDRISKRRETAWIDVLLSSTLQAAKRMGREYTITSADVQAIYDRQQGRCYWYNVPMKMTLERRHPLKPSLDRFDNERGYTPDNVVLACYAANFGRSVASAETFETFVATLTECLPLRRKPERFTP